MKQTELAAYDGDGSNDGVEDDSHETVTDGGVETDEQSCPDSNHHEDEMCRACRAETNDGETTNFVEGGNPHLSRTVKHPSEQESSMDVL